MISGVFDARVPDAAHRDAFAAAGGLAPYLACSPVFPAPVAQRQRGQQGFEFSFVSNDNDLFTVHRIFGKHAQVQHGSGTTWIFHNHVGAIQNVGRTSCITFVQVVDPLCSGGIHGHRLLLQYQVHKVEVVAALFNQSPTGVGTESVPVIYFGIKRFPVFANGHLMHPADGPGMRHAQHLRNGWHVAILLRDPHNGLAARG